MLQATPIQTRCRRALTLTLFLAGLTACGGGGSGPPVQPMPPVQGDSLVLLATSPIHGSTDVPQVTVLSATFNEQLDSSLLDDSWFRASVDGQFVDGSVSLSPSDGRQILLNLDQPIPPDTVALALLSSGIVDVQGRELGGPEQWMFTTAGNQATEELTFEVFPTLQQSSATLDLISARVVDAEEARVAISWQSHQGTASFFETAFWDPTGGLTSNLTHSHSPSGSDTVVDGQGGLLARVDDYSIRIDAGITVSTLPAGFVSIASSLLIDSGGPLAVRPWCGAGESATAEFDAVHDLWIQSAPLDQGQFLTGQGPFPAAGGGFQMIGQGEWGAPAGPFRATFCDRAGNLIEVHEFGAWTETSLFYSFDSVPGGNAILVLATPTPSGARFDAFDYDPALGWSEPQVIATTDLGMDNSDLYSELVALCEGGAAAFVVYAGGESRLYWRESADVEWAEQAYEHPASFGVLQPLSVAVSETGSMLVAARDGSAEVHVIGKPAGVEAWTELTNLEDVNVLQAGAITQQVILTPADGERFLLAYRGKPGTFEDTEVGVVLVGFQ